MNQAWLLRMARWVRHPPSPRRVALVLGVLAACLAIYGIEAIWGWPEALTVDRLKRP
jgi:hypothetical protein